MKTIYLVRHGESEANISPVIISDENVSLTSKGVEQATLLAKRCENLEIDLVVHSGMQRAKETAEIILRKVNLHHEVNPIAREVLPPSIILGDEIRGEKQKHFAESRGENVDNMHYRYDDEETLHEVSERAKSLLKYFEDKEQDNILIVSHTYFIRVLIATVLMDVDISPKAFQHLIHKLKGVSNTSISVLTYNTEEKFPWKVKNYNDESHLA